MPACSATEENRNGEGSVSPGTTDFGKGIFERGSAADSTGRLDEAPRQQHVPGTRSAIATRTTVDRTKDSTMSALSAELTSVCPTYCFTGPYRGNCWATRLHPAACSFRPRFSQRSATSRQRATVGRSSSLLSTMVASRLSHCSSCFAPAKAWAASSVFPIACKSTPRRCTYLSSDGRKAVASSRYPSARASSPRSCASLLLSHHHRS